MECFTGFTNGSYFEKFHQESDLPYKMYNVVNRVCTPIAIVCTYTLDLNTWEKCSDFARVLSFCVIKLHACSSFLSYVPWLQIIPNSVGFCNCSCWQLMDQAGPIYNIVCVIVYLYYLKVGRWVTKFTTVRSIQCVCAYLSLSILVLCPTNTHSFDHYCYHTAGRTLKYDSRYVNR